MTEIETINAQLMESVYVPTLVKSARENGIPVNTEADLQNLLDAAAYVEAQELAETHQDNPMLKAAAHAIRGTSPQEDPNRKLAKQASTDPRVRDALSKLRRLSA